MKKFLILFFILLLVPFLSAATIDTKEEYKIGETLIAKISASFAETLKLENIYFYRGHTKAPLDFEIAKLGNYYYIKASLVTKNPDNYSLIIKDINYYDSGLIIDDEITADFIIINESAEFTVDPGFILTSENFSIDVSSLSNSEIIVNIDVPDKLISQDSIEVAPGKTETIDFKLKDLEEDFSGEITLSFDPINYKIPIYLYFKTSDVGCGNKILELDEECDGNEWGEIESCVDFGFDSGSLRCFSSGLEKECTFDTAGCYNYTNCEDDDECDNGFECLEGECKEIKNYCVEDRDCDDDERCEDKRCTEKKDCEDDDECDYGEECIDEECVPKDRDCIKDRECDKEEICENFKCVLIKECESDDECNKKTEYCSDDGICKSKDVIDPQTKKTCTSLGGVICTEDQTCEGDSEEINSRTCCMGVCKDKEKSSIGKIIGWILIILIVLGLIFFYFKYKKTNRKNTDLTKLAKSPRVKDNLLR